MAMTSHRNRPALATRLSRALRGKVATWRLCAGIAAALLDAAAIVSAAILSGAAYHNFVRESAGAMQQGIQMGLTVALLAIGSGILSHQYSLRSYLEPGVRARRIFAIWNMAFLCALAMIFLTKTSAQFSRGSALAFYVLGLAAFYAAHRAVAILTRENRTLAGLGARRVFLLGDQASVAAYQTIHRPHEKGIQIAGVAIVRNQQRSRSDDLKLAAAGARMARAEDIVIALPWNDKDAINDAVRTCLAIPAAIHLAADTSLTSHAMAGADARALWSLPVARAPMSDFERSMKRGLDVALAGAGLVLLAPLLAAIAIAIRCTSRGPVLFCQRRNGFNREAFRILKFRSMTTAEDGRAVAHCVEGDARVTPLGKWLRRFNLDELPQLINVLRGDMSLVGPRPHAIAHDHEFDASIALYARRHNVKPGITGWAQVNGRRGGIETETDIRERVELDLHYIDNWSLLLDLRILALTIFSPKAYRNAR